MKTEDTIYDTHEATTLDGTQNNGQGVKAENTAKRNGIWKEVAIGAGTGILFGSAATFFTSAAEGKDEPQHPQVDEHIPVATCVDDNMSFSQAFAAARAEVGPGGAFEWHGNLYNTYTAEEWNQLSAEERAEFDSHFDWAASTNSDSCDSIQADVDMASKDIAVATCVDDDMSFSQAFAAARAEVGSGGVFQWHGNLYNTFTAEEWNQMSAGERANFSSELASTPIPSTPSHHTSNSHNAGYTPQQPQDDSELEVIHSETVTCEDGSLMDVAIVNVDGQEAILVDFNRDGIVDAIAMDLNANGHIDEEELVDVSQENFAMVTTNENPDPEPSGNVVSYETLTMDDGSQMDMAVLNVEGQEVFVIDADRNGTADLIATDLNQNGQIESEEIADISQENIAMQPFQQEADMNQNNYLAMGDEGPDYLNGANTGEA